MSRGGRADEAAVEALAEVRVMAGYIAEANRVLTPEGATRIANRLHAAGYRLVPPGSRVVSEGQGVADGEVVDFSVLARNSGDKAPFLMVVDDDESVEPQP